MTRTGDDNVPANEQDRKEQQREIGEVQEKLDEQADGDGLAAEAGRSEETGLAEG